VHIHPTLKKALDDAKSEFKQSIASEEWEPYNPALPLF
jgi:hypothetical protein